MQSELTPKNESKLIEEASIINIYFFLSGCVSLWLSDLPNEHNTMLFFYFKMIFFL